MFFRLSKLGKRGEMVSGATVKWIITIAIIVAVGIGLGNILKSVA